MFLVVGLRGAFRKLFFKTKKAEYFRFAGYNEYLITYWVSRVPMVPTQLSTCVSAIGNPTGHQFNDEIRELEDRGIQVVRYEISRAEFDRIARVHSILKNDSWVKQRLMALDSGIARPY